MDELDAALFQAWHEVSESLKNKPWALARRMERASRKELRRPVRAWCVPLRASDSRFGAHEWRTEIQADFAHKGRNHFLTLTGGRLRELCKPVWIAPPGVPVCEAAGLLGRDMRTVWSWVKKKQLIQANPTNKIGRKALVWSGPIDPQADDGRGPWQAWGTLWQNLWEKIPEDYMQRVQRIARLRQMPRDKPGTFPHFRGWDWKCPGRLLATGQYLKCGRVCKKLWMPLPVWAMGDYLKGRTGGVWEQLPRYEIGRSRFACAKCWGMRFDPVRSDPDEAWNCFVSVVSGGLLYGREVLMPGEMLHELY